MLVAFELQEADGGTLMSDAESGSDNIPPKRRAGAFRISSNGWGEQMQKLDTNGATP